MIMDQYKEQYRKETEQIHAPAELIARTKAAMREEEARIRREFALQGAGTESRGISAVAGPAMVLAGGRNYGKGFNVRKWAYPLTAAAALFILVSVSLMMRGLKSGDMAMDMGASETSGGADLDGGMMAAGAAMDFEGTAETAEDASADEMILAEAEMAAAPAAEMEDMSESASAVENAASETAEFSESVQETAVEKAELEEARKNEGQRKFSDTEKNMAEDTVPAESGAQSGGVAETESITIERVVKKPDFCGCPDTGKHVFEGQTFQVAEEGSGWMAYAETGDGGKYVIRGEAEDLETFLEMGYQKLLEQ
ncbi:hypothetical protein D7V90_02195 [bacterium 1xD42-87]|nr:hypothetical protein D7V90_02195 [bacterium 1xD42-87]